MPMHPKLRTFLRAPTIGQFARTLALCYVGLALFAAFFTNQALFHPPTRRGPIPGQFKLRTVDGNDITAIYLKNPSAAYVMLCSYGNGDDMEQRYGFYRELQEHGWAVCAYDYPGYGTSTGSPTVQGCYAAIHAAYDYLVNQEHIPPARIVVYGQSLGSGPSVDLASREPVGGLILESAYLSIFRVATHFRILPWDQFNNFAKINSVHAPLLSIHGRKDHIVPFWQGEELYNTYQGPKICLWVDSADHNDVESMAGENYWNAIDAFRKSLSMADSVKEAMR